MGYGPRGHKESGTTEPLTLNTFSLSYVVVLGWGQEICIYHKFPEDAGI